MNHQGGCALPHMQVRARRSVTIGWRSIASAGLMLEDNNMNKLLKAAVLAAAAAICLPLELWNREIISIFLGSSGTEGAMATGTGYLKFMGWFFALIGFKMATDGVLRGAGVMHVFTTANLVNLSIRVAVAFIAAPVYGVSAVWVAVPIGWGANWLISGIGYIRRRRLFQPPSDHQIT